VTLAQKIDEIVRTLEFYADKSSYAGPMMCDAKSAVQINSFSPAQIDRGQRARALLDVLHREFALVDGESTIPN
jgi:hypothetical protein